MKRILSLLVALSVVVLTSAPAWACYVGKVAGVAKSFRWHF